MILETEVGKIFNQMALNVKTTLMLYSKILQNIVSTLIMKTNKFLMTKKDMSIFWIQNKTNAS